MAFSYRWISELWWILFLSVENIHTLFDTFKKFFDQRRSYSYSVILYTNISFMFHIPLIYLLRGSLIIFKQKQWRQLICLSQDRGNRENNLEERKASKISVSKIRFVKVAVSDYWIFIFAFCFSKILFKSKTSARTIRS